MRKTRGNISGIFRVFMLAVCLMNAAWLDPLRDKVAEGNNAWKDKKFDEADRHYGDAEPYASGESNRSRLAFNRGDALYGKGDYAGALKFYDEAAKSPDAETRTRALYNRGNALVKLDRYAEALKSYRDTLRAMPEHENARKNIESLLRMNEQKNREGNGKGSEQNNPGNGSRSGSDERKNPENGMDSRSMTPEQARNLLDTMKNKPVRQQRGKGNAQRFLEKNW